MEFALLGPLTVCEAGHELPISSGNQRIVLAALLVRANQVVAMEELSGAIWGGIQPRSARVTAQNYVKRLRQALGREGPVRLTTRPGGYLLTAAPDELDITMFRRLCTSGLAAAGRRDWAGAAERLGAALALWRGQPFSDIPSETITLRETSWLSELRLQALEARIGADLQLGRPYQVITELQQLIGAEPLRERRHALLMLALYRCGQQAAALEAYRTAWHLLAEHAGIEPGPELRQLHLRILQAAPDLMLPSSASAVPMARRPAEAAGDEALTSR